MVFSARVIRVLIASPSDVQAERAVVEEVIHEWNALNLEAQAIVLLPVRSERVAIRAWRDRSSNGSTSRWLINATSWSALWTRIGTPTEAAVSDATEEIERFRAAGKPVPLYFSTAPVLPTSIDTNQWDAWSPTARS